MKNIVKAIEGLFARHQDSDEVNSGLDIREDGPYYPFCFHSDDDESSVTLYSEDEYQKRLFEQHNMNGNGIDWQTIAKDFIHKQMPDAEEEIWFDSDEELFRAYSKDEDLLRRFIQSFRVCSEDEKIMTELMDRL